MEQINLRKNRLMKEIELLKKQIEEMTQDMHPVNVPDDKSNPRQKKMGIGKKKFNMDPKKGIQYLTEEGLLKSTVDDISQFLFNGDGLNKTAIGNYLGEKLDLNLAVLSAFVKLHAFTSMLLVSALRQFLWSFRLPGEAQKIDRMMEAFAQHYCELNPGVFINSDTCYVLSFAIIMLNTSLHNPNVKDKPDLERFVNMNRGINDGGDLPRTLLESLYDSIKREPFKIPEDDDGSELMHTFFNPDKEGWLWKQGGRYKNWKRRWFILNDNCLYYFKFTTDKDPRGIIPLESLMICDTEDSKRQHCFELHPAATMTGGEIIKACKTDKDGRVMEGKHSMYKMAAVSAEEKTSWITCISASINDNPFFDMLSARREKAKNAGAAH